ncbi:MaoC family dehydratase [Enemella sp. A6]|uniref:MaoC family dehydratase n=1 Tax=Enemella sp. A6 TaxID=3440152 RepID=UPI003EBAF340
MSIDFDTVQVGDTLPEDPIEITRTLIIATALASRDYQDVHHDPVLAVERGSKDIFMNILTSNGMVDRYVTAWAGPNARVKRVKIRLGVSNYPGDTMTMKGKVLAKDEQARTIDLEVVGANSLGNHLSGTATIELPEVSR